MSSTRYASVIRLKPGMEHEYRQLHAEAWPAVIRRIMASNIGNYSIFLRDGHLFSYFEYTGTDFEAGMAAMRDDAETRRWWTLTNPCQEPVETAAPGERWAAMEEVFRP